MHGRDENTSYNPTLVKWKNEQENYSKSYEPNTIVDLPNTVESRPLYADFNGDGKRDFITVKDNIVRLYLNNNNGNAFYKKC